MSLLAEILADLNGDKGSENTEHGSTVSSLNTQISNYNDAWNTAANLRD